jgi:hypothetical protein
MYKIAFVTILNQYLTRLSISKSQICKRGKDVDMYNDSVYRYYEDRYFRELKKTKRRRERSLNDEGD